MTTKVITAHPEDRVAEVVRLLSDHGISALLICDQEGKVLGMLSEGDLVRPFGKKHTPKRAWWLKLLAADTDLAPAFLDSIRLENPPARDLMIAPVITASPDITVPELADLMSRHHVKRIPILQDGKLVGIVSRGDLVNAIARTPDATAKAL
jgi:CBS domain-containing protein